MNDIEAVRKEVERLQSHLTGLECDFADFEMGTNQTIDELTKKIDALTAALSAPRLLGLAE